MSADRSLQSSRSWKSRVRDTERSRASLHRARSTMLAGLLTLLTPTAFASWPVNIDGGTIEYDIARDMVVDSAGDVIAAGTLDGQFMVTKRKGLNGDAIWTTSLQIFAIESGMATAVAVDAAGDLIAAGFVEFPSRRDFCVIKLDGATGSTLWYRFLNGGGAGDSAAYDLILNGAGDVFATGYVDGPTAGTARLAVFKLDNANGATHWEHIYPHVSGAKYGFSFGKADMGHELALDPAGNVVVAGSLTDFMLYYGYLESFGQFTVIKLDGSTGSELWMYRPEWFLSCAFSVVVDAVGDVYAGGSRNGPDVVKLSGASGQVLWTSVLVNEGAEVQKVALAPNGDVVASGWADYYPQKFDSNTAVARIDGMSGLGVWEHRFASRLSEQMPFALDSHGDVYLAGVLDRLIVSVPASYHLNVEVVRLSGTSGQEIWNRSMVGSVPNGFGKANAVTLDGRGFVLVAGTVENQGTSLDFHIEKRTTSAILDNIYDYLKNFDKDLDPIWEDPLTWVFLHRDVEVLNSIIVDAIASGNVPENTIVSSDPEALLAYPDRPVLLIPAVEGETVVWIAEHREAVYSQRSVGFLLFLTEGDEGQQEMDALIEFGQWGPPVDDTAFGSDGEAGSADDGAAEEAAAGAEPGAGAAG